MENLNQSLIEAVKKGDEFLVGQLCELGADPNWRSNYFGFDTLFFAIQLSDLKVKERIVKILKYFGKTMPKTKGWWLYV